MAKYGFYIDVDRCIKCWACEIACKQWNGIPANTVARRKVHEVCEGTFPNVKRTFVSLSCMHCDEPACANVCPAGAIAKREEDGIVVVDKDKCIGCHYCFFACPFGVPQYTDEGMDKCDCCIGNGVVPGDTPHCVATCPTQALHFGTFEELGSFVSQKTAAAMVGAKAPAAARPVTVPESAGSIPASALKPEEGASGGVEAKSASCG